jgi:hypothetical protein
LALSPEEIAGLFRDRVARDAERHDWMRAVSDVYYGRTQLPLPELSQNEQAAVPNLCKQGTDQLAARTASVLPNQTWPSTRPGIDVKDELATLRRQVAYGLWEHSKMPKLLSHRARWFMAYAAAPVIVRPDPVLRIPRWELHSPFHTFGSRDHIDCYTPDDVCVRHFRTLGWLKANYPEAAARLATRDRPSPGDVHECIEYIDADEVVFCALARADATTEYGVKPAPERLSVEVTRIPNRAEMCWAVIPERISLDEAAGQFDAILGMYTTQAALMALQIIAVRKAIWPTTWAVNPNGPALPAVVQEPDSRTGTPGILINGILDRQQLDPSFQAQATIDHLEASQRQTAGLPAELGGSGSQNVRTGRRGSQIMAASIDFTIAEAQNAFAEALHDENLRAAAIDKAYFNTTKNFYVSTKGAKGKVKYTPGEIWGDTTEHVVEYPIAGTDLSDLVINGGQRVGMGTMSKRSFMDIDPLVTDAEAEDQRVKFEALEGAFLNSVQTLAAQPDGPMQLPDLTRLAKLMFADQLVWYEAAEKLQKEKQAEQAQGAPLGAPETMPGLATPGQGAEVPATIPGLGPGGEDMTSLLSQLGVADQAVRMR